MKSRRSSCCHVSCSLLSHISLSWINKRQHQQWGALDDSGWIYFPYKFFLLVLCYFCSSENFLTIASSPNFDFLVCSLDRVYKEVLKRTKSTMNWKTPIYTFHVVYLYVKKFKCCYLSAKYFFCVFFVKTIWWRTVAASALANNNKNGRQYRKDCSPFSIYFFILPLVPLSQRMASRIL